LARAGALILMATVLACARASSAQVDEEWDEPPVSETPVVERFSLGDRVAAITAGRVQIEGGYVFVRDTVGGSRVTQHTVPDLLLRFGLTERLEVRFGWPGWVSTDFSGPAAGNSSSDTLEPNVGFMFDLFGQEGWLPQTAVLAAVPITLEGDPLAMNSLQPLSQLLYAWYFSDRFAAGGATGVALFRVDGDHFVQWQQSLNVDYLLTDRLDGFLEWEVLVDQGSADDGSQHLLGAGISYLWSERFQTTWRAGVGANDRAPDFLTDLRFAFRF
jgi:hypothetical protein